MPTITTVKGHAFAVLNANDPRPEVLRRGTKPGTTSPLRQLIEGLDVGDAAVIPMDSPLLVAKDKRTSISVHANHVKRATGRTFSTKLTADRAAVLVERIS